VRLLVLHDVDAQQFEVEPADPLEDALQLLQRIARKSASLRRGGSRLRAVLERPTGYGAYAKATDMAGAAHARRR
jgi:hypothetical protein